MSLSKSLNPVKKDGLLIAQQIANKIRTVSSPSRIILFGSAAEDDFYEGSDIDLLLIFRSIEELQTERKKIRALGLLDKAVPVDLIFVSQQHFDAKKDIGGVCFIAEHEGVPL